jgi:DNA-binding transcriptional LysR family regulator
MENFFDQNKVSVSKKIELTSNEAVKQALLAGLGYSIMPIIGIKNELRNKELQLISVKGLPINSTWSLIWLKGKKHSPVSKAFISFLEENKDKIVRERFSWYTQY